MKFIRLASVTGIVVIAAMAVAQEGSFEPTRIERDVELNLNAPPEEVFELFSLAGRRRLAGAHAMEMEVVFAGRDGESGTMSRTIHPGHEYDDAWDVIADYDREAMTMRRVHYEPGTELLVEEIALEPSAHGATRARINWRVVGLTEEGNQAVQTFMDNHFDESMRNLEKGINDLLNREQPNGRAH